MRMVPMADWFLIGATLGLAIQAGAAADLQPAPQHFRQEVAQHFTEKDEAPMGPVQLVDCAASVVIRVFAAGQCTNFKTVGGTGTRP